MFAAKNLRSFQFIRNMYGVSEPQERNSLLRPKRVTSDEKNALLNNISKQTKSTGKQKKNRQLKNSLPASLQRTLEPSNRLMKKLVGARYRQLPAPRTIEQ